MINRNYYKASDAIETLSYLYKDNTYIQYLKFSN